MKTSYLFTILFIAVILVTACQDEEEGAQRQITETYTYSGNIRGAEGVKGELPLPDIYLTDIIDDEIANNLKNAELQYAKSYLEISGLNEIESPDTVAVVLEDFTIFVGSRQGLNLGNVTTDAQGTNELASDIQHSTNEIVDLIENVFSDVTSASKRVSIKVSFTPNVNIDSSDNVQLVINFEGRYYYVVRE